MYFDDNSITVGDSEYQLTDGLIDLLFKRNLTPYIKKTDQDKNNYGEILKATNAHKKFYKANESLRDDLNVEKMKLIRSIVNKSGRGLLPKYMVTSNAPIDYVHCVDPNELVDRLRLQVSERERNQLYYRGAQRSKNYILRVFVICPSTRRVRTTSWFRQGC